MSALKMYKRTQKSAEVALRPNIILNLRDSKLGRRRHEDNLPDREDRGRQLRAGRSRQPVHLAGGGGELEAAKTRAWDLMLANSFSIKVAIKETWLLKKSPRKTKKENVLQID